MNEYAEVKTRLGISILVGVLFGFAIVGIFAGNEAMRLVGRVLGTTVATTTIDTPVQTATSTVDTGFTEKEFVVYAHGTSTIKEMVKLPNAGYRQEELESFLQQRWAFHASKEPVCTFVRDGRFLRQDRIASFDVFKEKVCIYDENKQVWEPSK